MDTYNAAHPHAKDGSLKTGFTGAQIVKRWAQARR
jgi:hypothetical protein